MHARPSPARDGTMRHRRCGRSGLELPEVSLGLWQSFGHDRPFAGQREVVLHAVDASITHLDLANDYGPPPGAAEELVGRLLATDLRGHRDELVPSTKAGYGMWPGPYGDGGSRKHLLASLDQSLTRLGVDHVDVFYSHRADPDTPLEETMGALDSAVRAGKARYVGVSSYGPARTRQAAAILAELGTPLLIHQPSYSLLNRWIEDELLDTLDELGVGSIVFSPLGQGLLNDKHLDGVPEGSRAAEGGSLTDEMLGGENLTRVRALAAIARRRGQSLAQMAVAWVLRDPRVTPRSSVPATSPSSRAPSRRSTPRPSATTSSPRSTSTSSTAASTSGSPPATCDETVVVCARAR